MKILRIFDSKLELNLDIYVGENAQDNWNIIDISSQNDIWFHLDNKPSSHVILCIPESNNKINKQTILYCASICKQHSKFSNHKNIPIIYTEIKNISKGIDIGSVYTKKIKRVHL